MDPLPQPTCPLCGAANACAPVRAGHFGVACWCAGITVDARALERLPAAARGRACLCRACATGEGMDPLDVANPAGSR